MQELLLQARISRREKWVARIGALPPQSGNRQVGKLRGFDPVLGVALVVNRQLLAGLNAIARIGNDFQPNLGGSRVFAAALGHQRKFAARFGAEFPRQLDRQGLSRSLGGAAISAAARQKSRQPEEIEAVD